jgi:hypothetical protein
MLRTPGGYLLRHILGGLKKASYLTPNKAKHHQYVTLLAHLRGFWSVRLFCVCLFHLGPNIKHQDNPDQLPFH